VGQCSAADARELEENDAFKLEIAIAAAASTDPPLNPADFDVELQATAKCDSGCGSRRRLDSHGRILAVGGTVDADLALRYKINQENQEITEEIAVGNAAKNVVEIIVKNAKEIALTLNEDTVLDEEKPIIAVVEIVLAPTPAPVPEPTPDPAPLPTKAPTFSTIAPAAQTITSPISTDRLTRRNRRSRFLGFVH